jgi:hypothetical protein
MNEELRLLALARLIDLPLLGGEDREVMAAWLDSSILNEANAWH